MTIITVTIDFTEEITTSTRKHRGTGADIPIKTTHKLMNNDSIKIEEIQCGYGCECTTINEPENNDDKLTLIGKLVRKDYLQIYNYDDADEKINDKLQKIEKIIEGNKYAQIRAILDACNSVCDTHEKYNKIKLVIGSSGNDNSDPNEGNISFSESDDNDYEDDIPVVKQYPFAVDFVEKNNKYIAKIHATNDLVNDIYITVQDGEDGFCCSPATNVYKIPKQLTLVPPFKKGYLFEDYNYGIRYKKQYGSSSKYIYDINYY